MSDEKVLVVYVDGWDRRYIDEAHAPFMSEQFSRRPWVKTTAPASVDLLPTILTGTRPDQHGMYGVRLRPPWPRTLAQRAVDLLPDWLTTSVQCILFGVSGEFDLPAVPPRRRRLFDMQRSKVPRSKRGLSVLLELGGMPTCMGVVGEENSRYIYSTSSDPVSSHLKNVGNGDRALEFLQIYAMDLVYRWNYANEPMIEKYARRVDDFLRRLHAKCSKTGVTLVVLSDHGYDATEGSVNSMRAVRRLRIPRSEYTEFIEITSARYWFHSERARREITAALEALEHTAVHRAADLRQWGVELQGKQYGEFFCLTDPGWVFHPNDFHNPLGNFVLGIKDPKQRGRLTSPKHRGNHVLRPGIPAASGFVMVLDERYRATKSDGVLENIAPTLLSMLGREAPDSMSGKPIFER
ncbi:MAG: hypothetical protein HKN20_01500 [Gemmatimonadetes bacterium]|nr:hypothetical protein [Gemmatimonadota bacterium]